MTSRGDLILVAILVPLERIIFYRCLKEKLINYHHHSALNVTQTFDLVLSTNI